MPALYVHLALTLALAESLGLGLLLLRIKGVPAIRLLVAFLFGVGAWVLSCELPIWFGAALIPLASRLVALTALTAAVFLHFVLELCELPKRRRVVRAAYLLGGAITVIGLLVPPGHYQAWRDFPAFFFPNVLGWTIGIVWALLAFAGHGVMAWCWLRRRGPPRGQLVALCIASGWGASCMTGYAFPVLGFDFYPVPLLLLPLYPVILVYGILRYQLMVVNAWARRTLAWTLMVGLGSAGVIGLAALPLPFNEPMSGWHLWAVAVTTLLASGLLLDPFRRLATRLIYPGSQLAEGTLQRWQVALSTASSYETLAERAERALGAQLRIDVKIMVAAAGDSLPGGPLPTMLCLRGSERWTIDLRGWEAAPPGPLYIAQLFGAVLAESAGRLEQAMALVEREREQQKQERLAELGALAATVAHDIRNPLNIIAMAAATAPADVRREIAIQTSRISQLATDLLDYAKSWQIDKQPLDVADYLHGRCIGYAGLEFGAGLVSGIIVGADARRLGQALQNLLDNARAAIAERGAEGRIHIDATRNANGSVEISICDNGAGVPPEIRHTLFQPFVSRRVDGTGLGLAIVAKIIEAHGGSARLDERPGWSSCFVIALPPDGKR